MIWSEAFTKAASLLEVGQVVTVTGRLDLREEGPRISANEVKALRKPEPKETPVILTLDQTKATEEDLLAIRDIIKQRPGRRKVELRIQRTNGAQTRLLAGDDYRVEWSPEMAEKLAPWL